MSYRNGQRHRDKHQLSKQQRDQKRRNSWQDPDGFCETWNKWSYASQARAERALAGLQHGGREEKRTYLCPDCQQWHLTHQAVPSR